MADKREEGQKPPSRNVRIVAYLLGAVLIILIPIAMVFLYEPIQNQFRANSYTGYGQLGDDLDLSREGGHLLPNMDTLAYGERWNRPVRWITNSKGFRNISEFAYQVSDGTFRVLIMGDSYVDGYRTDQERTIGFGLEKNLSTNKCTQGFRNYQVMLSGHNNPASALYNYQEHGQKYNPHLVILGITVGNDITPRTYKKTLWPDRNELDDGNFKLVVSNRPSEQSNWRELLLPDDAYTEKARVRDSLLYTEFWTRRIMAKFLPGLGYVVPPVIGEPWPNKRHRVHAGSNLTSLGLFYDPLLPEVAEWFRDLDEVIFAMNGQVVANGGKLLVVIFPTRAQADYRDWSLLERFYSLDGKKFRLDYPGTRIQQFCQINQIDCLDLLPSFIASVQRDGTRLYMERGDMHFNVAGQALASETISNHICSSTNTRQMISSLKILDAP